jgi:hypothetical protein
MHYENMDSVLRGWANLNGLTLMVEPSDARRRVIHTSSAAGETFQIVVEPEEKGMVRVDAHLIESPKDELVHFTWSVTTDDFAPLLNTVLEAIRLWFGRA